MKDSQIYRFKLSELTSKRVLGGITGRIKELPNELAWAFSFNAAQNRNYLKKFYNIHRGERCFIMGNGPSLSNTNFSLLKNEITFGLNRIYLLFDKMPFMPTYYVCINHLILQQFGHEIQSLPMPKFVEWGSRHFFKGSKELFFLKYSLNPIVHFSKTILSPLSVGGTVTYIALQLAFFMGFEEVILIGVDHNFQASGTPNATEVITSTVDNNHFAPNYFPKGAKWQIPDLLHSEYAYNIAKQNYEAQGRKIFDATQNGKCPIFEKVVLSDLF